jgi:hypothetical protein
VNKASVAANPQRVCIRIESRERLDEALTKAVESVKSAAIDLKTGILVTRHSYDEFSVAPSDGVPFREIHERSDW